MLLQENTVVAGRFRLTRLIGQGGMGSVWQATHLGLDIPCAVKFIEGEMAKVPEMQMRFEREAKAAAQLRSPHVVQILDHGVSEGTPYIAMELLDGEDLRHRFAKTGPMPPAQMHQIIGQVCRALSKAHSLGIVHRDLKPDNIFLVRDDDREIAKVLDFGIAKSNSAELGGSNTRTGAMLGTPYYMSPEQAQGTRALDYRSDLWSLAVITFQGLTGRLPFESEALGDLLMKIMMMDLPIPSQYGCALPGLDGWWRRAAARDPALRFQSAKEFADSLALVCGVSQLSGVHERPPMIAPGAAPFALQAGGAQGGGAQPQAWGPPAHLHGSTTPDAVPAAGMTHAPMTRTFGEGTTAPKSSVGPYLAIGAVVVAAVVGLVVFTLHATSAPTAAASASGSASSVTAPSPSTSASTAAPVASTSPSTRGADASAPTSAPSVPAAPDTGAVAAPTTAPAVEAQPKAEAAPAATPKARPSAPAKPSPGHRAAPADLGF